MNDDASYQRTSPCTDHDCQHGVCIATGGGNNYKCQCDQGYTGNLSYNINIHTWLTHTIQYSIIGEAGFKEFSEDPFLLIIQVLKFSVSI